jgi:hypothetical protein
MNTGNVRFSGQSPIKDDVDQPWLAIDDVSLISAPHTSVESESTEAICKQKRTTHREGSGAKQR